MMRMVMLREGEGREEAVRVAILISRGSSDEGE